MLPVSQRVESRANNFKTFAILRGKLNLNIQTLDHSVELLSHTTSFYLMIFVTGSYKKMTIRNPMTTVRQMCTEDFIHMYLADMIQHVLGAYCEI